jgi:hypothetical protein
MDDDRELEQPDVEETQEEGQETEDQTEDQGEGAEAAPDAQETEPEAQPAVHRKQTANERIQQLANQRKALESELTRYRDHVLELTRRQEQAPRAPAPDPEATRRHLENMGDIDRILWLQQEQDRKNAIRDQQFQFQVRAQNDRLAFDRIIAENPQYARYSDMVETEFHRCLQNGYSRSREELLSLAIGNEVRKSAASSVAKAKKAGATRVQQATTKPASARSGVAGTGGKATESAEDILRRRLENGEYGF